MPLVQAKEDAQRLPGVNARGSAQAERVGRGQRLRRCARIGCRHEPPEDLRAAVLRPDLEVSRFRYSRAPTQQANGNWRLILETYQSYSMAGRGGGRGAAG